MRTIHIERHGGPEVLNWTSLPDPTPGPGQAVVRPSAIGVNYMDIGARETGMGGWGAPVTLGVEGAGRVVAVGDGVELAVGDRVAWFYVPGSYAELVLAPAEHLVKVPDDIDDETAAAVMMQGLTANHFTTETYAIKPGDVAVVHAAAGGVGLMLTQMIRARGGTSIGLVSRPEKVAKAQADHVLVSSGGGFEHRIRELTGGEGAHVVYDGGGAPTFRSSQLSLRRHGVHVYYGPFMGVPTLTPMDLPNSILLSYAAVADHVPTREALIRRSGEVFDLVRKGQLTVHIGRRYPLKDAAQAHVALESRATTGKLLLLP
jgi:NADPH2:quinone reductase